VELYYRYNRKIRGVLNEEVYHYFILFDFWFSCFGGCSLQPKKITAQNVVDKLKETQGIYMANIKVVTAENDDNKLLGRPNQYTEKISWEDNRETNSTTDCTIEIFANNEDATARKEYIDVIIKSMPMFTQYMTLKGNMLLRIQGTLTPTQAEEYTKIFNTL
jgi:hypothetical protein